MDSTVNGSAYGAVPEQLKRLHGWMASGGGVDGKGLTDANGYDASRAVADVWRSFEEVVEDDRERGCGIGWVIQPGYVVFDLDDALDENGDLRDQFKAFVDGADTYIERSFSGRGLHAFVKSSVIPEKDKRGNCRRCSTTCPAYESTWSKTSTRASTSSRTPWCRACTASVRRRRWSSFVRKPSANEPSATNTCTLNSV